jgi:phosphate transport system protein
MPGTIQPASESASSRARELASLVEKACLTAKDAAANLRELFQQSSRMAVLAIKDCETELDHIEREIDEKLPGAIARVGESRARELLACLKFITDLERIGDLMWWIAQRASDVSFRLAKIDRTHLDEMASILENMLGQVHTGFVHRDVEPAYSVLRLDKELDRLRHAIFRRHVQKQNSRDDDVTTLFIVQSLERAGDHATNLAEEIIHLVEHRSIRHLSRYSDSET